MPDARCPMPDIELFCWYLNGRNTPTSWRMTREDALARDPQASPDVSSREVRSGLPRGNDGARIVAAGGHAPSQGYPSTTVPSRP